MNIGKTIREISRDLRSFERGSADSTARAQIRHRSAIFTGITSAAARIARIGVSIVTVPLTLHYLGNERFGLWMTISSVLAMASFADFGIGNGVINTVADAYGKDDQQGIREVVSSGFAVLTGIAILLLVVFGAIYPLISWGNVFNVTSQLARHDAGPAIAVFTICFALNIPVDVVQRVQLGLQQGFRTNFWQIISSLGILIGILWVIHSRGSLSLLMAVLAGMPVAGTAINAFHFFSVTRRDLLPRWQFVSRKTIARIARFGALFFVLQVVVAVAFSADNFIVARVLGASAVTEFSIPERMFGMIVLMVTMLVTPLWPAYGEAISRGDMDWVRATLRRSLWAILGLTTLASAVLLVLAYPLMRWWVGPSIHPPFLLLLGLSIWTVISSCGNALAAFLNGAGIVRFQVIVASIFGASCLLTKIYFTKYFGIVGVPWATILTYVLLNVIPCAIYVPRLLRRINSHPAAVDFCS